MMRHVALLLLLLLGLGYSSNKSDESSLIGYRPVVVVSGSMEPAIMTNSISILEYCGMGDIGVGDIVMYYSPYSDINITHRVIDKGVDILGEEYLITKGDANELEDNIPVTSAMLRGKLVKTFNWAVPFMDYILYGEGEVSVYRLGKIVIALAFGFYVVYIAISIILVLFNHKKYIGKFRSGIEYQANISDLGLESGECWRKRLAKLILLSEVKDFNKSVSDLEKAVQLYEHISGETIRSSQEQSTQQKTS